MTAFATAQAAGGRFLLRIEDTDFTRCRPDFEAAIYEDLAWLGLSWETPVRRQSEYRGNYDAALKRLHGLGVLYRCFRTRKEVLAAMAGAPQAGDPADGLAFRAGPLPAREEAAYLDRDAPFAWRLSLKKAASAVGDFQQLTWIEAGEDAGLKTANPWPVGDLVLGRKDIGAGYNIAVVVDDALQGVTEVVRGVDLAEVTSIHRVLQSLLGLPTPIYRHHRLLTAPDGKRLSKRDGSAALRALRASGVSADNVRAGLGFTRV